MDEDEIDMEPLGTRSALITRVVSSDYFDYGIGVVIILNSVLIGVEQSYAISGEDTTALNAVDNGFLVIYICEVAARLYVFGFAACVQDAWVRFDILLVVLGVVMNWILMPTLGSVAGAGVLMVLRMMRLVYRLLKLVRTFRLLMRFRELWMLMRGLVNSATTMLYTALTLFLVIFIFGTIGVEIVTKHELSDSVSGDPEFAEKVHTHFENLPKTMLTLLQFTTLDDMDGVYRPLIEKAPWLILYFASAILIISIVLMNLITAVVVNSAMEQAMQDKEVQALKDRTRKKRLIQELSDMFARIDCDHSGEVSKDELENVNDEDREILEQFMTMGDPVEIFETLDVDNTGSLSIQEFCDGIWHIAVNRGSIEVKRTEKKVDSLKIALQTIQSESAQRHERLLACMEELREMVGATVARRVPPPAQVPGPTLPPTGFAALGRPNGKAGSPRLDSPPRQEDGAFVHEANLTDTGTMFSEAFPEAPKVSPKMPERSPLGRCDVHTTFANGSLELIARNTAQPGLEEVDVSEFMAMPRLRAAVVSAMNEFQAGIEKLRKQLEAIDNAMLSYCQLAHPSHYRRICSQNRSREAPSRPTTSRESSPSTHAKGSPDGPATHNTLLEKWPLQCAPSCKLDEY